MQKIKAFALILAVVLLMVGATSVTRGEPAVGVKAGDWIEYTVRATGTPPPEQDLDWVRIEILDVEGSVFHANFTVRNVNGTVSSAIRNFNFTEGTVADWIIIPSKLNPGDTFYDTFKQVNVTIEGEKQKIVADASRTVTHASDAIRNKEWDKATGVFTGANDNVGNYTINAQAVATNMWSPQILGLDQTVFYALVAVSVVMAIVILALVIAVARRKKIKIPTLSPSAQAKIAALTILLVILFEIGTIFFFPFYEVGLSFAQINLIMQTIWTAFVLVSMWFRMKGNYFVHEILMLIVMCAWWVGFSAVLFMNPFSGSTDVFSSTPLRLVMNALHGIFSVPALIFGTWLVALWRPGSTTFAAKSRRIAQLTTIFWVPSYIVGVLDFMVLHTTLFG